MCGETNRYVPGRVKLLKECKKLLNDQCLIKKMLVHKKKLPKHIPLGSVSFFLSFFLSCIYMHIHIHIHIYACARTHIHILYCTYYPFLLSSFLWRICVNVYNLSFPFMYIFESTYIINLYHKIYFILFFPSLSILFSYSLYIYFVFLRIK